MDAGAGNDTVCGGAGGDTLDAGPGNDRIFGERDGKIPDDPPTHDALIGGPGDDYLDGGEGVRPGSRGKDTVSYRHSAAAVTLDLAAGTATGEGTDTIVSIEQVLGSDFGDTLYGNARSNRLEGLAGDDQIWGRAGSFELIIAGTGADVVYGGRGYEIIMGGDGDDQLYGRAERDFGVGGSHTTGDSCFGIEVERSCELP